MPKAVKQFGLALGRVRGERGRALVLEAHEKKRAKLVQMLRDAALARWRSLQRPVSTNDVRHILVDQGYKGDPRILAAAFPRAEWRPVSYMRTNSPDANARDVRGFIPKEAWSTWTPEHQAPGA